MAMPRTSPEHTCLVVVHSAHSEALSFRCFSAFVSYIRILTEEGLSTHPCSCITTPKCFTPAPPLPHPPAPPLAGLSAHSRTHPVERHFKHEGKHTEQPPRWTS